jgi:hypothetical protein
VLPPESFRKWTMKSWLIDVRELMPKKVSQPKTSRWPIKNQPERNRRFNTRQPQC